MIHKIYKTLQRYFKIPLQFNPLPLYYTDFDIQSGAFLLLFEDISKCFNRILHATLNNINGKIKHQKKLSERHRKPSLTLPSHCYGSFFSLHTSLWEIFGGISNDPRKGIGFH